MAPKSRRALNDGRLLVEVRGFRYMAMIRCSRSLVKSFARNPDALSTVRLSHPQLKIDSRHFAASVPGPISINLNASQTDVSQVFVGSF